MQILAVVKRVFPFLLGFIVGVMPSWLFMPTETLNVETVEPKFEYSSIACKRRAESDAKSVDTKGLRINSKPRPIYKGTAPQNNT